MTLIGYLLLLSVDQCTKTVLATFHDFFSIWWRHQNDVTATKQPKILHDKIVFDDVTTILNEIVVKLEDPGGCKVNYANMSSIIIANEKCVLYKPRKSRLKCLFLHTSECKCASLRHHIVQSKWFFSVKWSYLGWYWYYLLIYGKKKILQNLNINLFYIFDDVIKMTSLPLCIPIFFLLTSFFVKSRLYWM